MTSKAPSKAEAPASAAPAIHITASGHVGLKLYEREIATYLRELPRLLAEGRARQHVLIKGGEIVGVWKTQGKAIQAIEVDVPRDELFKRLTGRRSCPVCGEIYNIYSKPPKRDGFCDAHPGAKLDHRTDDSEDKVKVRLETYDELTKPLLEYYERSGRLQKVDGTGEIEEIYRELNELI